METFTEGQLPLLKDITDAGSNHAAIALSQLLNRAVQLKHTRIQWLGISNLHKLISDPDAGVAALSFRIFGEARGNILILFPQKDAQSLVMQLNGHTDTLFPFVEALDISAIKEAGNILAGAYLNAVCNITNIVLLPSVPALFQETAGNAIRFILQDWNLGQNQVCVMETELLADSRMTCYFCLVPDKNFLERAL
ncbi:chemotaxis protein CheC [bacterium]|nr:chemotaxis protein CheC [bacterium]